MAASLEAPVGTVTITLTNESPVPHDVAIRGDGVDEKSELVQGGGTAAGTSRVVQQLLAGAHDHGALPLAGASPAGAGWAAGAGRFGNTGSERSKRSSSRAAEARAWLSTA